MLDNILDNEYNNLGLKLKDIEFVDKSLDGLIVGNTVYKSKRVHKTRDTNVLKAHEMSHYLTNPFNLLEADSITQAKFERIAIEKTAEKLFSLDALIELWEYGARTLEDFAEALEISQEYVYKTLEFYKTKYGNETKRNGFVIHFLPLRVCHEKED